MDNNRSLIIATLTLLFFSIAAHAQQTFVPICAGSNDTARFTAILASTGSNDITIKLPYKSNPSQRCTVSTITLPVRVTLDNIDGSGIAVAAGQTLTVQGPRINPPGKVMFFGPGTTVTTGPAFTSSIDPVADGQLSANVALKNAANIFTGINTFAGTATDTVLKLQDITGQAITVKVPSGLVNYDLTLPLRAVSSSRNILRVTSPVGFPTVTNWTLSDDPWGAADGGTGKASLGIGNLIVGNQTSPVNEIAPGASGWILGSNGSAWAAAQLSAAAFPSTLLDTDPAFTANSDTRIASQKAVNTAIQNAALGLQFKAPVQAATTAAGTLATSFENGDTVDGVVLATGNRIKIKNQADPTENGIYLVEASGAPTRAPDADTGEELSHATVLVEGGTANSNTGWTVNTAPITIGVTPVTVVQYAAANVYVAGTGLDLLANQFSIEANAVTNALAAQMATKTYKGRTSGGTGDSEDVPVATLKTDLALVKGDVGLSDADNTSDITKDAAATTLTNKTIVSPVIANIAPAANFTLSQNSVAPFTSVNAGAVANTLYLDTGKVGIGTNAPVWSLDVVKNQNANTVAQVTNSTAGSGSSARFVVTSDAGFAQLGIASTTTSPVGAIAANDAFVSTDRAGLAIGTEGASGVIKFFSGGIAERVRIAANGNVGIGTAAPTVLLDVAANTDASMRMAQFLNPGATTAGRETFVSLGRSNAAGGAGIIGYMSDTATPANGKLILGNHGDSETTSYLTILKGGNVGIGPSSPASKLEVAGIVHSTTGGFKFPDGTEQITAGGTTNASNLTSGTVALDRLATGSALQIFRRNSTNTTGEFFTLTAMQAANNLSDVASPATAFANIKQAATTTTTGVVELATAGENVANVVVQGNDPRVNLKRPIGEFASFATAVSTIASTPATLLINALTTAGSNVTVPSTLVVEFTGAGQLSPGVGTTTTIPLRNILAPLGKQIFAGAGSIILTGGGDVSTEWFAGADFSVKANAADAALSTDRGTIVWPGGADNWSTSVVLNSDHALQLGSGTLTTTTTVNVYPLRLKSRTAVRGAGMHQTVITEPTYNTGSEGTAFLPVIYGFGNSVYPFNAQDDDIEISDLQILGANTFGDGGTRSAIGIGNGKNATISRVFINGTHGLGITMGGLNNNGAGDVTGDGGPAATRDGFKIMDSLFRGIWGQNANAVNGRNGIIKGNTFLDMAKTGCFVDFETNTRFDFGENLVVEGNTFDSRNTPSGNFINGVCATNANNSPHVGNLVVSSNTFIGGKVADSDGSNAITSANAVITANWKDVVISGNAVRRMGQSGFNLHGDRFLVTGNLLEAVGGGGVQGMVLQLADSRISNNLLLTRINSVISADSASDVILESSTAISSTVNTSGVTVTRTAGSTFSRYPTMQGQTITINGSPFTVSSITSADVLVLTATAGTQTGVTATFSPAALYARNTYESNESDYTAWTGVNATNPIVLNGASSKIISHFDRVTEKTYHGAVNVFEANVGIGTAAPLARLDVQSPNVVTDSHGNLRVATTTAQASNIGGQVSFGGLYTDAGAAASWAAVAGRKENGTTGNFAGYLQFATAPAGGSIQERMRINSAGNVGIGTASPGLRAEVVGTAGFPSSSGTTQTGAFRIAATGGNAVLDIGEDATGLGAAWLQVTNRADLSQEFSLLLNPNGGNVGIGTTSPQSLFQVKGQVTIDPTGTYNVLSFLPTTAALNIVGNVNCDSALPSGIFISNRLNSTTNSPCTDSPATTIQLYNSTDTGNGRSRSGFMSPVNFVVQEFPTITYGAANWAIASATNASSVEFTVTSPPVGGDGFVTGLTWTIEGATGDWTAINGTFPITVTASNKFTILVDSSAFGALSGTVKICYICSVRTAQIQGAEWELYPGNPSIDDPLGSDGTKSRSTIFHLLNQGGPANNTTDMRSTSHITMWTNNSNSSTWAKTAIYMSQIYNRGIWFQKRASDLDDPFRIAILDVDAPAANIIKGQAGWTVTNGVDISAMTVTTSAFKSPGFNVDGSGGLTAASLMLGTAGPTWTKGTGAPAGACTTGSLYSRTDGTAGATLYVCEATAWAAK